MAHVDCERKARSRSSNVDTRFIHSDDGRVNINLPDDDNRLISSCKSRRLVQNTSPIRENLETASTVPLLNIVIQIVGSRGDIQPFVALGVALKQVGHRIRIATHADFKQLVDDHGLEFFDIGGDPKKLMAYMVRNPGLLPKFETIRTGQIKENRSDIREIMEGCWRSCFEDKRPAAHADSIDASKPFMANAIIANPPSFAHVHCAEKLGIPLHLMFTMPWSPTHAFPHPLANIQSSSLKDNMTNYLSYLLVEMLTWEGLGDVINSFRRKTLGLKPLDGSSGPTLISQLRIPFTYCWSPNLIAKPQDWEEHISISGFFFLPVASDYSPPDDLRNFLIDGDPPIYIGFGSIVVNDPVSLTLLLIEATKISGVRAVISQGWSDLGLISDEIPPNVLIIGNCPHDWIFNRVSCAVHHGGAGTTAAAMAAGIPSIIVPFFGDQPFWGKMVARTGTGPQPIPFKELTAAKLSAAIVATLQSSVLKQAKAQGASIARENGVQIGVSSFHQHILQSKLSCSVSPFYVATWKIRNTDIRLSACAAAILIQRNLLDFEKMELFRPCAYDLKMGPRDPFSGMALVLADTSTDIIKGIDEVTSIRKLLLDSSPSALPNGVKKLDRFEMAKLTLRGIGRLSSATARLPLHLAFAFCQGAHNLPILWGDNDVRRIEPVENLPSGFRAAGKEALFGIYDGFFGFLVRPFHNTGKRGTLQSLKGIGKGTLSLFCKPLTGSIAVLVYPAAGVEAQVIKWTPIKKSSVLELSLLHQGAKDATNLNQAEHAHIISEWQELTHNMKPRKLKSRFRCKDLKDGWLQNIQLEEG